MKGISLIELLVAIALITTLSVIGTNSFINIKNDADIDAVTDELISDIKLARNKSMNGEILESETEEEFDEGGLPEYGMKITANNYQIIRQCSKGGDTTACSGDIIENVAVNSQYNLFPETTFFFSRITGISGSQVITILQKDGHYGREISLSENFVITITEN